MKPNEPGSLTPAPLPKNNQYKNVLIGFLSLAVICLLAFVLINKGNSSDQSLARQAENQQPIAAISPTEENELRKSFDESLARLDSLTAINSSLNKQLEEKNKEISDSKAEIRRILNNKNATAAELKRAKELIASLNEKISTMEQEITQLTQEKETLTREKEELTQANEKLTQDLTASNQLNIQLTDKVDVASTLNASNISITPVKIKKNEKEKITHTAKRVDKLMITFDVNNRIAEPGMKDIYVAITGPDGKLITADQLGSGTFTTREEGDKMFTTKVPVEVETAKSKKVEFSFKPGTDFKEGNYLIQIYQNGFKIGEGKSELKKGGLFG